MSADDQKQRLAQEVCAGMGLSRIDAQIVVDMVDSPESSWPPCCDSGCSPCVEELAAAARRVRALLGLSP